MLIFNDKEYELKFGFKAILMLEKHYNEKNLSKLFSEHIGESFSGLAVMVWAGIKHQDKNASINKVENMIHEAIENEDLTIDQISEAVNKAIVESKLFNNDKGDDSEKK